LTDQQLSLPFSTPISEIAVLLLAHPQVTLSQAVLSRIAEAGGSVVTIDRRYLPASLQLPVQAHFLQTERFAKQMRLSLPNRKRLWQQMVRAKIRVQGELLKELYGSDAGLVAMSARVRSDDAQATWKRRRHDDIGLKSSTIQNSGVEVRDLTKIATWTMGTRFFERLSRARFALLVFIRRLVCGTKTATMPFA
jgi:hypothetical protein